MNNFMAGFLYFWDWTSIGAMLGAFLWILVILGFIFMMGIAISYFLDCTDI
jgi:hypothetical protein